MPTECNVSNVLLAFVLHAMELLSDWYLGAEERRLTDAAPPLMDLLWPKMNPATCVLQFLTALVTGEHMAALILRYCDHGRCTFQEWQASNPAAVCETRSAAVLASAWVSVRNIKRWQEWPWPLVVTGDPRRESEDHAEVAQSFDKACRRCPHCLDKGHGTRLRPQVQRAGWRWLLEPAQMRLHGEFARLYDTQNDCRERKHAEHKRTFCSQTQLDHFSAKSLLQDTKSICRQAQAAQAPAQVAQVEAAQNQQDVRPVALADGPAPPLPPKPRAFKSIEAYYHNKFIRRDVALGLKDQFVSKPYRKRAKDELDALTREEKEFEVSQMRCEYNQAQALKNWRRCQPQHQHRPVGEMTVTQLHRWWMWLHMVMAPRESSRNSWVQWHSSQEQQPRRHVAKMR